MCPCRLSQSQNRSCRLNHRILFIGSGLGETSASKPPPSKTITLPDGARRAGLSSASQHPSPISLKSRASIRAFPPLRTPKIRAGNTCVSLRTSRSEGEIRWGRSEKQWCEIFPVERSTNINREASRRSTGCWAISFDGRSNWKSDNFTGQSIGQMLEDAQVEATYPVRLQT